MKAEVDSNRSRSSALAIKLGFFVGTLVLVVAMAGCDRVETIEEYFNHPDLFSVSLPAEGYFTKARWFAGTGNLHEPRYKSVDVVITVDQASRAYVTVSTALKLQFTDGVLDERWHTQWSLTVLRREGSDWEYKGSLGPLVKSFTLDSAFSSGDMKAVLSTEYFRVFELGQLYTCFLDVDVSTREKSSNWTARVAIITIDLRSLQWR